MNTGNPERKTRRPRALKLSKAAEAYGYHRVWLQGLLIDGKLEGWKEPATPRGHWFVTVRAMEQLLAARRRREGETEHRATA